MLKFYAKVFRTILFTNPMAIWFIYGVAHPTEAPWPARSSSNVYETDISISVYLFQ